MGMHWTGIVFGLGAMISMGYWTTDFLVVQRVLAAKDLRSAKLAPDYRRVFQDVRAANRDSCRDCWAWPCCRTTWCRKAACSPASIATTKCCR